MSESSLKRWCDRGLIPTIRTAGGHRRLPLSGVIDFLRQGEHELVRPEVLGLPASCGSTSWVLERAQAQFTEGLFLGDEERCRQVLFDLYLARHRLSAIGDQVIAPAFAELGARWECGDAEIYQERRACEICLRALYQLSGVLEQPGESAPLAIGAAAEGDHYQLPTTLVEMTFRARRWRAFSLGCTLPFATLAAAVKEMQPHMFWISVSHVACREKFLEEYREFYQEVGDITQVVLGGRGLDNDLRAQIPCWGHCTTLADLESSLDRRASDA